MSVKSVALMTWFSYQNYGTALQVAALRFALQGLGYAVNVVDYPPKGAVSVRPVAPNLAEYASKAMSKVKKRLAPTAPFVSKQRGELFSKFLLDELTLTGPCPTMAELEGLNDCYAAFVCGSDQIWSPANFDPHYFLDFAGEDRLKVAYAPSVGLSRVDDPDIRRQMAKLCVRIDGLSTREDSGSRIVSGLTGREVATVVDPTLLLRPDDWAEVAEGAACDVSGDYLVSYMLGRDETQWRRVYGLARKLGLAVRVIPVFQADLERKGCIQEPVGPREFVSLIANASYVCTDSFHGVAFSVNLGREFCAFERFRKDDAASQNSRVYNLLDKVGLRGRLAKSEVPDDALVEPIAWEEPSKRLRDEREASLAWLRGSLEMKTRKSYADAKPNVAHDRTLCCGCTACAVVCPAGAIDIRLDAEGFWRANVDQDACVSCTKCRRVCPFIEHESSLSIGEGALFSYKAASDSQLLESSSGGAGDGLERAAAQSGAAVLGCAFDVSKGSASGKLVQPGDSSGIASLAGSKYMQSEVGGSLAEAATHEGALLITGTPCQVAAARNVFAEREDVTYVDLICHGVPTRLLYARYREWLFSRYRIDPESARTVFRYKPRGWRERFIYTTDGVREACLHQRRDPYFLMFEASQCYASCCYECPWRASSAADLRLGDYWGPRYQDDKTGVSMLLALTDRGRKLVQGLSSTGAVSEAPLEDYMAYQQTENTPEPVFRDEVIANLADPGVGIMAVCDEFAEPVAKRRDLDKRLKPAREAVKRLLGRR